MSQNLTPTGIWNGYFLEHHRVDRGWMHLYLEFENGQIRGEGTDYVGPWHIAGSFNTDPGQCHWVKQYMGQHSVTYDGQVHCDGIRGNWRIGHLSGRFHIWPERMTEITSHYLAQDAPPGDESGDKYRDWSENPIIRADLGRIP